MKNKHMILSDRIDIEKRLNNGNSIRKIGRDIGKPHTTILHEISMRKYLVKGNTFNLLPGSSNNCIKLEKSPYICNNCDEKRKCSNITTIFFFLYNNKDKKIRKQIKYCILIF